jgi:acyl carrier protein
MPDTDDMRDKVLQHVFSAIDELNLQLAAADRIAKSEAAVLTGSDGALESLAFLNLIVSTEDRVNAAFGVSINLASMLMESDDTPPPRSVADLVDLITTRVRGPDHG